MKIYLFMLSLVLSTSALFAQTQISDGRQEVPASAAVKCAPIPYAFQVLELSRSYDVSTQKWSYDLDNIAKKTTDLKPQAEMALLEKEFLTLLRDNPQLMQEGVAENFKKQFPAHREWVEKAAATARLNSTKGISTNK